MPISLRARSGYARSYAATTRTKGGMPPLPCAICRLSGSSPHSSRRPRCAGFTAASIGGRSPRHSAIPPPLSQWRPNAAPRCSRCGTAWVCGTTTWCIALHLEANAGAHGHAAPQRYAAPTYLHAPQWVVFLDGAFLGGRTWVASSWTPCGHPSMPRVHPFLPRSYPPGVTAPRGVPHVYTAMPKDVRRDVFMLDKKES